MSNCKTNPTPVIAGLKLSKDDDGSIVDPTLFKRLVESLIYLTTTTLDIVYALNLISRFMESPKDSHSQESKRILRYVSSIKDLGIIYSTSKNFKLIGYTNSDNEVSTKKSHMDTHFILVHVLCRGIRRNNP